MDPRETFPNIPDGWRVLWCPTCGYAITFTDDIAEPYDAELDADLQAAAVHEHA